MLRIVFALLALAFINDHLTAQVTTYSSQASFLAAINGGSYLETFDGIAGLPQPSAPLNFSSGGFTYSVDTNPTNSFFMAGPGGSGGGGDVWVSTNSRTDQIIFTFTSGNIRAIGGLFFGSDINGAFAAGNVFISTDQTPQQLLTGTSSLTFLGFISQSPFTTLTLSADQSVGALWPTANDFIVGNISAVPEPATWAMIGVGSMCFAGSSAYRRWRNRKKRFSKMS